MNNIHFLFDILRLRRPYGSPLEEEFANVLFETLPGASMDRFGNIIVETDPDATTLFSCHTDTISSRDGRQAIVYSGDGRIRLHDGKPGQSLGADDGAGIWMMCHMILANKPGIYVFHRGEECGGLGSKFIRDNSPGLLAGVDRAVAFDRRGRGDVITHQLGSRCCSDEFAFALANQLPGYRPSDKGIFTDTAFYTELVPECTNISVGYENEHGPRETLDFNHLNWLLDRVMDIDFEILPVERDPGPVQRDFFDVVTERPADVAFYFEQRGVHDLDELLDEFLWSEEYEAA